MLPATQCKPASLLSGRKIDVAPETGRGPSGARPCPGHATDRNR